MKIPITRNTLKLRLRRTLQPQRKHLRMTTREEQRELGLGLYYVVSAEGVIDPDVNLEELARELGVMQSWETLKPKR